MSMKLVTKIKDIKGIPGKSKRVLEAWAAFANHDGTNIFASKESVASKAGISKWTVFRNTDDLVAVSVLLEAQSHTCKTEECDKGAWHYAGNGHYTRTYNINVAELQNATQLVEKLSSKMLLGQGSKMPKSKVAKSHATQSLKETQSGEPTRSVLTDGEGKKEGKKETPFVAPLLTTYAAPPEPVVEAAPKKTGRDQEGQKTLRPFFNPLLEWVKPLDKKSTQEELGQTDDLYTLWWDKTSFGFQELEDESYNDSNAAVRMIREYGFDGVMDILQATWECPKTAGITWKDWSYWCDRFPVTRSTITAWRNKVEAQQQVKAKANGFNTPMLVTRKTNEGEVTRTLERKPLTKAERRELLDALDKPKTNREYILGFLAQDSCPKCHGEDSHCDCVMTEEVIVGGKPAWDTEPLDAPPPIPQPPPPELEPEPALCVHGWNPKDGQCWECTHPPNRKCAGCGKMFWVPGERTQPFCTHECGEAHHQKTKDEMVKRGLAQPVGTKHPLAAFLDGE
jgi:hypothetical protein